MSRKRKNIITVFGTALLALFSFQFLMSAAMMSGLLPDACASLHATSHEGNSVANHSEDHSPKGSAHDPSHPCACSCHHAPFFGFSVTQVNIFVDSVVQENVSVADDFPSDGIARLIYLPPRLS